MLFLIKLIVLVLTAALPNHAVTPGAINPNVTQSNIHKTICVSGFTSTIRPSSSYTTNLKKQQLASGYAVNGDFKTSDYEEDHLISLEIGGAPSDPKNLWPEPYAGSQGARVKDQVENKLHTLVCSGQITLKTAQTAIASNWINAYKKYVGAISTSGSTSGSSSNGSNSGSGSSAGQDPRFATCKAANAAGYGPYYSGQDPEYAWYRDANKDGKVC